MSGETLSQVLARLGMTVGPSERQWASARMGRRAVRRADGSLFCDGTAGELWDALQKAGLHPVEPTP